MFAASSHPAPADATAPKCTSPAAIRRCAVIVADDEAAVLVDRLEYAAQRPRPSTLHRDLLRRCPPRAPASAAVMASKPAPAVPQIAAFSPRHRTARETASPASQRAPSSRKRRRRIGQIVADAATTLTPMPIDQRIAAVRQHRRLPAGCRQSFAPSARTSFGHLSSKRLCAPSPPSTPTAMRARHDRVERIGERQPATKPSVAACRAPDRSAAARRRDCRARVAQARPRRPRPPSAVSATIQSLPGSPARARVQRNRVGRADVVEAPRAGSRQRRRGASANAIAIRRSVCAAASASGADRAADQHVERARKRRTAPKTSRSSPAIGTKPPTGSSNHMILMMRR